jgi:hypothetical protein
MLTLKQQFHNVIKATMSKSPSFSSKTVQSMLNQNWYSLSFPRGNRKTGSFLLSFSMFFILLPVFSILLAGCRPNLPKLSEASPSVATSTPLPSTAKPTAAQQSTATAKGQKPSEASTKLASKTVALDIFRLDNQCNKFISEKANVPADQRVTQAIAQILRNNEGTNLDLSGYRVKVASGVATIDFRVASDSQRSLASLSNCEQLALYGSIRRTLIGNRELRVKSVRFTDRGKVIKPE